MSKKDYKMTKKEAKVVVEYLVKASHIVDNIEYSLIYDNTKMYDKYRLLDSKSEDLSYNKGKEILTNDKIQVYIQEIRDSIENRTFSKLKKRIEDEVYHLELPKEIFIEEKETILEYFQKVQKKYRYGTAFKTNLEISRESEKKLLERCRVLNDNNKFLFYTVLTSDLVRVSVSNMEYYAGNNPRIELSLRNNLPSVYDECLTNLGEEELKRETQLLLQRKAKLERKAYDNLVKYMNWKEIEEIVE